MVRDKIAQNVFAMWACRWSISLAFFFPHWLANHQQSYRAHAKFCHIGFWWLAILCGMCIVPFAPNISISSWTISPAFNFSTLSNEWTGTSSVEVGSRCRCEALNLPSEPVYFKMDAPLERMSEMSISPHYWGIYTSLYSSLPAEAVKQLERAIWLKMSGLTNEARAIFDNESVVISKLTLII